MFLGIILKYFHRKCDRPIGAAGVPRYHLEILWRRLDNPSRLWIRGGSPEAILVSHQISIAHKKSLEGTRLI